MTSLSETVPSSAAPKKESLLVAKSKRIYRAPLVITVAAWIGPACGGDATTDDSNISDCATGPGPCDPGDACRLLLECTSGTPQTVVLVCNDSGYGYDVSAEQDRSCDRPYDACVGVSGTYDCIDGNWAYFGGGGNPPAPCPQTRPEEGSSCRVGGSFGADRSACGYPCDAGGWTVTGCVADAASGGEGGQGGSPPPIGPNAVGHWESDGACVAQGGRGGA